MAQKINAADTRGFIRIRLFYGFSEIGEVISIQADLGVATQSPLFNKIHERQNKRRHIGLNSH